MNDPHPDSDVRTPEEKQKPSTRQPDIPAAPNRKKRTSMHDGIAVWCDCCSCKAEPYWAELAEELGIDLGDDYEKEDGDPTATASTASGTLQPRID